MVQVKIPTLTVKNAVKDGAPCVMWIRLIRARTLIFLTIEIVPECIVSASDPQEESS